MCQRISRICVCTGGGGGLGPVCQRMSHICVCGRGSSVSGYGWPFKSCIYCVVTQTTTEGMPSEQINIVAMFAV